MALQDLATVADLEDRNVTIPTGIRPSVFLAAAQDAVREAAGVPITAETFTVTIPGGPDQWLSLPGQPVTVVTAVLLDATSVTDWKLVGGQLWRRDGWELVCGEPSNVTATITGGLVDIPKDLVDLVCAVAGLGMNRAAGGDYSSAGDLVSVSIDDYTEQHGNYQGKDRLAGPLELPPATRERLRARFGGGAALLRSR